MTAPLLSTVGIHLMPNPTFKEASDALCLSMRELAEIFNVSPQSVKQARLDPQSRGYRPPPPGWERVLAKIARERGRELADLARALEAAGRG